MDTIPLMNYMSSGWFIMQHYSTNGLRKINTMCTSRLNIMMEKIVSVVVGLLFVQCCQMAK